MVLRALTVHTVPKAESASLSPSYILGVELIPLALFIVIKILEIVKSKLSQIRHHAILHEMISERGYIFATPC